MTKEEAKKIFDIIESYGSPDSEDIKKIIDMIDPEPRVSNPYVFTTVSSESDNIPDACKNCSNHPSNGGSGICHCTLGLPKITC